MPDPQNRVAFNVPGRWYIDASCVNCGLCPAEVPDVFRETPDGISSYVWRQPQSPQGEAACEDMAGRCPTNSIGNDGAVAITEDAAMLPRHA
ncbi:ferredoxin [bacterium]|nr:MAG: ferredoxin [bacterium]RIK63070.1 MAG: ferredoxin [Planctomycetota bacterium]